MERIKQWLTANPLARLVLARLLLVGVGAAGTALVALGLLPAEVAACLAHKL